MPDPQDQPEHRPEAEAKPVNTPEPAEPHQPAKKTPAKKASAKPAKKPAAKKAGKNGPAKKTPGKKAPAKSAQPADGADSRQRDAVAKEAAAHAKTTVDAADSPVGPPQRSLATAASGRSPAVVLAAATLSLLALLVVRQLRRRSAPEE